MNVNEPVSCRWGDDGVCSSAEAAVECGYSYSGCPRYIGTSWDTDMLDIPLIGLQHFCDHTLEHCETT